jgi:hypothetical protein
VYDASSFGKRRSADVLGARYVDRAIVLHRAPESHHAGEMQDSLDTGHGRADRLRVSDVSPVDVDALHLERTGVLAAQREHTHPLPALPQRLDDVAP